MKATCRIGSLILAICLFTCFTANGLADSKSETDQAKQQLTTDWESMLAMVQTQEEIIFFALDCLDAYTANPSWTNLVRARVACTMANSALSSLVWPTHSVTRKQQYALIEAGVATEILSDYQSFDFRQQSSSFQARNIDLEDSWFEAVTINNIKKWSRATREHHEAYMNMLALETNYLDLPLFTPDDARSYWQTLTARYPLVFASHTVWNDSVSDLEVLNGKVLERIDKAFDALKQTYASKQSTSRNGLYDLEHGVLPEIADVTGAPKLLPTPIWFDSENAAFHYFTYDRKGNQCDLPIRVIPDTINVDIQQQNVSLEEAKTWINQIEHYGTTVTESGNSWYVVTDDYTLNISWSKHTVTMIWLGSCDAMMPNYYLSN